jgi:small-conductance mechanosensitive channel
MRIPAQLLVFLVGAHVLLFLRQYENDTASTVINIVELLLVVFLVVEALETFVFDYWLGERKQVELPAMVRYLVLIVIYGAAVVIIIDTVTGKDVLPLLATSTVLTAVLGLALQDTLGNLFAGLALSLEKSLRIGDWVLVDGVEGKITYMGWRAVHLRTFTADLVVVPNRAIGHARVQNFTRPEPLTARNIEVMVAGHVSPADAETAIQAALLTVPAVLQQPKPRLWLVQMTALGNRFVLNFWVADFAHHDDAESDVLKAICAILQQRRWMVSAPAGVDGDGRAVARV